MPQNKEKNKISVAKFRTKMRTNLGDAEYKKTESEARQQRRIAAKNRKKEEDKMEVNKKVKSISRANLMVGDIFTRVLSQIPEEKVKRERGRKPIYQMKEGMSTKEQANVKTKLKRREYMRDYMKQYNLAKRASSPVRMTHK